MNRIVSKKLLYDQQETLTQEDEHFYAVDENGNYLMVNDDGTPFDIKAAYTEARDSGRIYPYRICLDENNYHTYERIGTFNEQDLKNGYFNEDYTEITLNGERYHLTEAYLPEDDDQESQEFSLWIFSCQVNELSLYYKLGYGIQFFDGGRSTKWRF